MKAYHLTESENQGAAIIFGRFNPPHFGHSNAWTVASKFPIWYVGTNQDTQGPKDPLPYEVKIEAMKTIMPEIEEHLVSEQSWWTLATMVYKQHGGNMVLHIVTDPTDKEVFVPSLKKFNGVEGPHGFYQFQDVVWAPATRDSTATALRAAVEHNNPQAFSKAAGIDANTMIAGQPFFELVKHYMTPYLHAAAEKEKQKAEKEQQKADKLAMKQQKTKGPAQELVESGICWTGYKRKPGTKKYSPGSCVKDASVGEDFVTTVSNTVKTAADKVGDTLATALPQDMRPYDNQTAAKFSKTVTKPKQVNEKNKPTKRLSEELTDVYESRTGSIQDDVAASLPATYVFPGLQNQDAYKQYRFGLAIADVRGRKAREDDDGNVKFQSTSPWGENEVIVSFDPGIEKVLDAALISVGQSPSDKRMITTAKSEETKDVTRNSPVANIKRNKYGI